jgi:hypothetical protein
MKTGRKIYEVSDGYLLVSEASFLLKHDLLVVAGVRVIDMLSEPLLENLHAFLAQLILATSSRESIRILVALIKSIQIPVATILIYVTLVERVALLVSDVLAHIILLLHLVVIIDATTQWLRSLVEHTIFGALLLDNVTFQLVHSDLLDDEIKEVRELAFDLHFELINP